MYRTLPQTANFLPLITTSLFSNSSISGQLAALGESRLENYVSGVNSSLAHDLEPNEKFWQGPKTCSLGNSYRGKYQGYSAWVLSRLPSMRHILFMDLSTISFVPGNLRTRLLPRFKNHWWEPNSQSSPRKESYNYILPLQITELASLLWLAYTIFLCSLTGESLVNAHIFQE